MTIYGDVPWLADVLREAGLPVWELDGWKNRGHGDMGQNTGVGCHHTAGGGTNDWKVVAYGRSDLPGPLAHLTLERDGTFRVLAAGVCWHAGRGSWPGIPTNNANDGCVGIEGVSDGVGQGWTDAQLRNYPIAVAAILRRMQLGSDRCWMHREWSSEGKIDPTGIDGPTFRREVQNILNGNQSQAKQQEDDDMSAWDTPIDNQNGASLPAGVMLGWIDKHTADLWTEQPNHVNFASIGEPEPEQRIAFTPVDAIYNADARGYESRQLLIKVLARLEAIESRLPKAGA